MDKDRFFKNASSDRYMILKENAQKNRNNPTDAEMFMWKHIKGKSLGLKFIRQHAILDYIVDFVCLEKKLIIEIDGEYHFTNEQIKEDKIREERLINMGYKIIRFKNNEVLFETPKVINTLKKVINNL